MSLADLSSVATIVSGLAVLASLAYLNMQVRQNLRHTRALIQQGRAASAINELAGFVDADACAAWIVGNGGAATPEAIKSRQFQMLCAARTIVLRDAFAQHEEGLLEHEQFQLHCIQQQSFLREPGFRAFLENWLSVTAAYAPLFSSHLRTLIAQTTPTSA